MEFGYVDSIEYIELEIESNKTTECEQPKPQKHVTFAPYHEVHDKPIYHISTEAIITTAKPISILKETNYKYSKYNHLLNKFDDYLTILLIFTFVMFFEKSLRFFF